MYRYTTETLVFELPIDTSDIVETEEKIEELMMPNMMDIPQEVE